jgi:cytochrome c551
MLKYSFLFLCSLTLISCDFFHGQQGTIAPTRDLLKGKKLYIHHCAQCHQDEGEGIGTLYPPIKNADYLQKHFEKLPCIIRNGMHETITVNGKTYDYEMFAIQELGDYEIAAVCNFIAWKWQIGDGKIMTKEKVTKIISSCE